MYFNIMWNGGEGGIRYIDFHRKMLSQTELNSRLKESKFPFTTNTVGNFLLPWKRLRLSDPLISLRCYVIK